MRLDSEHIEEYCQDIEAQVQQGVCLMPLFNMTLTPEGDPAIDKAALLSKTYREYKKRLSAKGIPSGVLIQASIGHGWKLNQPSSFKKYVGLSDGSVPEVCCPLDENFRAYIRAAAKTIAAEHPDHIMLDDDFRLMFRPQRGCACELHLAEFNRLANTSFTREQLYTALRAKDENSRKYRDIYVKTQIDSLTGCAKEIRAGIDEVDPKLSGSFCACGAAVEGAYDIAKIMAGEENPIIIRVNNGDYCSKDHRAFAHTMLRLAIQKNNLSGNPDVLLAETDTCPQNRYSTPATRLHSHLTFSILEGAAGAKHWITRLASFEPNSGKAYRKKLGANRGFYEELINLTKRSTPVGCRIPMKHNPIYAFEVEGNRLSFNLDSWATKVLDRFGVPMHFTKEGRGVNFFDKNRSENFTNDELIEFLSGNVVLDGPAAEKFIERGLGEYLGVDVKERPANAKNTSGETVFAVNNKTRAMCRSRELIPQNENVKEHSEVYFLKDGVELERLFPGVTSYKNSLGGTAVVFSGDTDFLEYNLTESFGFLNETRKAQLISILEELGELPVYYPDDAELLLRAHELDDGSLMVAVLDMSLDTVEELPLVINRPVSEILRLMPDGSYKQVGFKNDKKRYELDITAQVFDPVILIIK